MSVTLDHILALAGTLDDRPGFDSARERFRRFLLDYARDAGVIRTLIEQCQHSPSDQHHRALQDLIVLTGRPMGFDVTFGVYSPAPDAVSGRPHWRSKSGFHAVLDIRTHHTASTDLGPLAAAVEAAAAYAADPAVRTAGLCILTPSYANRRDLETAAAAVHPSAAISVLTLRGLSSVAAMIAAGRLSHVDVVRLLESNLPADFVVDIVHRSTDAAREDVSDRSLRLVTPDEPRCWIACVTADHSTAPEEFLDVVVRQHRLFGITDNQAPEHAVRRGDLIGFYIPEKGVVGRAVIQSLADSGPGAREAHRFRQLLQLKDIDLFLDAAAPLDPETQVRMRTVASLAATPHSQTLVRISRESFTRLTEQVSNVRAVDQR